MAGLGFAREVTEPLVCAQSWPGRRMAESRVGRKGMETTLCCVWVLLCSLVDVTALSGPWSPSCPRRGGLPYLRVSTFS